MSETRGPLRQRLQVATFLFGATLVRVLPESLLRPLFRAGADVTWRRQVAGVRQLERNLRRVVGPMMPDAELRRLSREAMRSYARYWLEFFRLPVLGRERILGRTQLDGLDHVANVVATGRGVVLALPHSGNWDQAGAWLVVKGFAFTTVAERLEPASLFDRFVAVREQIGMEVLPLTGGERNTFTVLMQRLRAGKVLCLVADREIGDNGIDVSFFGEPARMPAGPATLALATGAALMPATLWYSDDGPGGEWRGRIHPEIEPPADGNRRTKAVAMTQHLADVFAAGVAAHPRDWHMLQPLWTADRQAVPRANDPGGIAASPEPAEAAGAWGGSE